MKKILVATISGWALTVLAVMSVSAAEIQPKTVLDNMHWSNQMEVMMGKMATEKAQSTDVKAYGETLVKDHSKSDRQVGALAEEQGIAFDSVDNTPDKADHDKAMEKLSSLTGADFDKAFVEGMVKDHEKDIKKLTAAGETLPSSPVRDLVAKTLPVLKRHLKIAQALEKKLNEPKP